MVLMKRLLRLLLVLLALGAWTSIGINFRASSDGHDGGGTVTDGAGETYSLGWFTDPSYSDGPVSRGGATFGWDGTVADMGRDRDSFVDRRLAGVNQATNNGTQTVFRLDLPSAGSYTICMALGDVTTDSAYQYAQVLDNGTPLFTIDEPAGTTAGHFLDATGVDRTTANWAATQACRTVMFSSTILNVKLGSPSAQANSSTLAHIDVTFNPAAAGNVTLNEDY
jgi:hypothetical protein